MGNLFAIESIEKRFGFFQIMNFLSIILFGTAAIGIAVCADELINIWIGNDYIISKPFAILIGIETLVHGLTMNLGQIREVSGVFRQMWFRPIISVVINLVVSVVLVQICGVHGVIIGTIASAVLTNLLIDPYILYKYSFQFFKPVSNYYKRNILYLVILTALFVLDSWLCRIVFTGHGWFSVVLHIILVSVSVPLGFMLFFWKTDECRYLIMLFTRTFRKLLRIKDNTGITTYMR